MISINLFTEYTYKNVFCFQVQLLSEKITSLVQEAEEAGTRGDVEQAQGLMKLCDRLKEEKEQLLKQQENRLIILFICAA